MEGELRPAAIYVRQSRTREGSESLETQVDACSEAAERLGCYVVETLVEPPSTSGYKERGRNRAKFIELLDGFREKRWHVVLAYKTDRLSRGGGPGWAPLVDAIEEAGLNTDRAVATPSGYVSEFEIGIRASMDREESKKLSERMTDNAVRAARDGRPNGGRRPFGYDADLVTLNQAEADGLRAIADKVLKGWGWMEITYWANEQGYRTTGGKPFQSRALRTMLKRSRYAGLREHNGVMYPAQWPAVFDTDTWERLQLAIRLKREASTSPAHAGKAIGLLHGLCVCGECDAPLYCRNVRGKPYKHKEGRKPDSRVYYCRSYGDTSREGGCGTVWRNADILEEFIGALVLYRLDTPGLGKLLNQPDDGHVQALLDARSALQGRLDGLADDYALGVLTRTQMKRANVTCLAELERLDREIATVHKAAITLPAGQTLRRAWESAESLDWKRSLFSLLIEKIVVKRNVVLPPPKYELNGRTVRFDDNAVDVTWLV